MRGQDAGDTEVRALTLLIQLFGREAIEALSAAGFRDNETIARAGPERLSEAAGIPLALARRIAAVAVEAHEVTAINAREGLAAEEPPAVQTEARVLEEYLAGVAAAGVPSDDALPAAMTPATVAAVAEARAPEPHAAEASSAEPADAEASRDEVSPAEASRDEVPSTEPQPVERHVRRPLRRPHSRLVHPDVPAVPRHAAGGAGRKRGRERPAAQPAPAAPNTDPFIDDVGLVHWMGFAGRGGGAVPFSVADAILEPGEEPAVIIPAAPPVLPETVTAGPAAAPIAPEPAPAERQDSPAANTVAPQRAPAAATAAPQRPPAPARTPAPAPEPAKASDPAPEPAPAERQHSSAAMPAPGAPLKGSDAAGGSFWSFGRLLQSPGDSKRDDPALSPKGPTSPRRRTHDGH